jgi:hypothetical protein
MGGILLLLWYLLEVWIVGNHDGALSLRSTISSPIATAAVVDALVLYLEALVADLESIHLFNGGFS